MDVINCPACGAVMERKNELDLSTDVCTKCGGVFLDKNELNTLATGMSGDIEYCSIDQNSHPDTWQTRNCPRCNNQAMQKINLLRWSDIIFDFCPHCDGFFLDKNELQEMNAELRNLSGKRTNEELRESRNGRMLKLDVLNDVVVIGDPLTFGTTSRALGVYYLRNTVYYKNPLSLSLRITAEKWTAKLAKLFGLFNKQDITTGNSKLDSAYVIQGRDETKVRSLLSSGELQELLLEFASRPEKIFAEAGSLEVLDNCVVYTEGPYTGEVPANLLEAAAALIERMLHLAELLDVEP